MRARNPTKPDPNSHGEDSSRVLGKSVRRILGEQRDYLQLMARSLVEKSRCAEVRPSDVVQATLMEAIRDLPAFHGDTLGSLKSWLEQILRRNLADELRKKRRRPEQAFPRRGSTHGGESRLIGRDRTASSIVAADEEAMRLKSAMEILSADHRTVIHLRNHERLKFREIGERMGRTEDAARMLWARAIDDLKHLLRDGGNKGPRDESGDGM